MINLLEKRTVIVDPMKMERLFFNSLKFIVQAYTVMIKEFPLKYRREDDINDLLYEALVTVLQSKGGSSILRPYCQYYNPMQRKIHGKASQVDISISWEEDPLFIDYQFYFECKRLSCKDKSQEYVDNGINRYEKNFYVNLMPYAAMIGYVEVGNVIDIVNDINKKIGSKCLNKISNTHKFYWKSRHSRLQNNPIDLYHIFLDFRDCQDTTKKCFRQTQISSRVKENHI